MPMVLSDQCPRCAHMSHEVTCTVRTRYGTCWCSGNSRVSMDTCIHCLHVHQDESVLCQEPVPHALGYLVCGCDGTHTSRVMHGNIR